MSSYSNTTSIDADLRGVASYLEEHVSPKRRRHIYGVADTAEVFASRADADPKRARLAGLSHDMCREWDLATMVATALRDGKGKSALEEENPVLLHGRAAAQFLREEFSVRDDAVLDAVRHHTLGTPDPSKLDLILYCADYLEPNRPFLDDNLNHLRESGGLETMTLAIVDHIRSRGLEIADRTEAMAIAVRRRLESA